MHDSDDNKCLWLGVVYVATTHLDNNENTIPEMVWEIRSEEEGCWRHVRLTLMYMQSLLVFSEKKPNKTHFTPISQNISHKNRWCDDYLWRSLLLEASDDSLEARRNVTQRRMRKWTFDQMKLPVFSNCSSCENCFSHQAWMKHEWTCQLQLRDNRDTKWNTQFAFRDPVKSVD